MVYFFSNVNEVFRYEKDLLESMENGKKPLFQLGISEGKLDAINIDKTISLSKEENLFISEEYLSIAYILLGQLLGFYKSLDLKLKPDSPSRSGAISRVVKGVTIY